MKGAALQQVTCILPVRDMQRARRFYERWGFIAEGRYAFMVGNHADEDVVMRRPL